MAVNLSPEDITKLQQYETQMGVIAKEIERAERAGVDVTELKAQFVRIENLRSGLLKEYGPPTRRRMTGSTYRREGG